MTQDGWQPEDQPARSAPQSRYHRGSIWAGAAIAVGSTILVTIMGIIVRNTTGSVPFLGAILTIGGLVGALVAGIVLILDRGSPKRRGLGLGLVIGWGATLLVVGVPCVLLIIHAWSNAYAS